MGLVLGETTSSPAPPPLLRSLCFLPVMTYHATIVIYICANKNLCDLIHFCCFMVFAVRVACEQGRRCCTGNELPQLTRGLTRVLFLCRRIKYFSSST